MKRKKMTRILAAILALFLLLSTVIGGLSFLAEAATVEATITKILRSDGENASSVRIKRNNTYAIDFTLTDSAMLNAIGSNISVKTTLQTTRFRVNSAWKGISLTLTFPAKSAENQAITGSLKAEYKSQEDVTILDISNIQLVDGGEEVTLDGINLTIDPATYFGSVNSSDESSGGSADSGGGSVTDDADTYTSQIVVENAVALDSAGNRIDVVTKDTPSFTLEIVFADVGLHNVDVDDLRSSDMQAYITNAGGFILGSSAKGSIVVASTNTDYPRFRARFTGVTFSGTGNDVAFTVFYLLDDTDGTAIKGDGTAKVYSAKADEEDDEDEDKMGLASPKIIISEYSYGQEAIVAGSEFKLDFTVRNTSSELPLENIVVTLTPASNEAATKGPGLIVASSSNTIYLPSLDVGATQSYSVAFQARPDAEVTSHLINIRFSYEYIDTKKKERITVPDLSESVAIPVSQLDRFSVDPILESPYGMVGEEAYLTVNFINKGKSTTYNVSGTVKIDESVTAPAQHHGNLEAGAADSMDFYLTGTQPGTFEGSVIIQYEDENNTAKEIETPFTFTVEEPYYPTPDPGPSFDDPDMTPPPSGPGVLTIVLCAVGGLSIAVPIALYLMKRVRAKGNEDFDEII